MQRASQLLAAVALAPPASAAATESVHEVWVASSGGSDASSGGSAATPVATLRRARELLRDAPRPATVHVGAGSYFLGNESLALGPADGGGVEWRGPGPGAGAATIYAGTRISGWQRHGGGGLYRAPWGGPRFFALTEGSRPAALARHPDPGSGYLSLTQKTSDTVGWASGSVPPFRCSEPQQCQAYLQCNYFTEVHNVALGSVNLSTGSLKYEQAPHCSMSTHPIHTTATLCDESAAYCCDESPRQTWGWAACT